MILDKTLVLKGVAGVAALGGVVAGGFVAQSAGLFSSSSNPAAAGEGNLEDAGGKETGPEAADGALTPDSPTSTEDPQGIPNRCNSSTPCELTEEELKKIKFEVLEEEGVTGDVTVEGFPTGDQKVTLTIDSTEANRKRYIFNNPSSSQAITIKRGEGSSPKTVTLKANGKTKFTVVGEKLKERTLGTYGLPTECETSSPCTLTSTDLEDIKFEGLGTGAGTVSVAPKKKVSLTIEATPKRYKFNNASGSEITIKKGSDDSAKTVTLISGETTFREESNSLRYVEPTDNYGVPTRCNTTSPCDLSEENLKNIKFETLEEEESTAVTVDNFPSDANQKITLTIDATEANKKKYIFSNGSSSEVKIKRGDTDTKTVTLKASGRTKFTLNSDKLKQFELNDYGLPKEGCDSSCSLTYTDLEDIKFDGLDGALTIEPKNQKVSLSVESVSSEKRFTFSNSSSPITIKKTSSETPTVTLEKGKENRFKVNSGKLKKIELNDKGLPSDCNNSTCTLTPEDLKHVKFPGFESQKGNVTVNTSNQTVSLNINSGKKEYSFNNGSSSAITVTKGSASVELAKEGPTVFYEEEGKLVKTTAIEKLNGMLEKAGFPTDESCKLKDENTSVDCKLTKEKFTKLKFKGWSDTDQMQESQVTSDSITAKIEKNGKEVKITFPEVTSISVDKKTTTASDVTIYVNSSSEFFINSQNRIEKKSK